MAEGRFAKRVAKQRDAAIVRSFLTCFNEHGCFETTLDQVAADVGIGKGTLYHHYRSKEDLVDAACRAGTEALIVRCRSIWETHAADHDAALRAVIGDLVALNRRGDPLSPATLARLRCGHRWLNQSHPDDGRLERAFSPLVRDWQAIGLLDQAADSSLIAAVIVALINSPAVTNYSSGRPAEESEPGESVRSSGQTPDGADHLVELIRRVFPPIGAASAVEKPSIESGN